jgi:hypothetical protein
MLSISIHDPLVQLPWGVPDLGQRDNFNARKAPAKWLERSTLTPVEREQDWNNWVQETLDLIAEVLWPVYEEQYRIWRGNSVGRMNSLTETDLRLMLEIQDGREVDKVPDSPLRSEDCPTHLELFRKEDADPFVTPQFYNRMIDEAVSNNIYTACWDGVEDKLDPAIVVLKSSLQRPRPMQLALFHHLLLLNFRHSTTAHTPSMVAGHCLQGLIGVAALLENNLDNGVATPLSLQDTLTRWAIDIGDRRILAGVHYPSDGISSWIVFLRIFDKIFHQPSVKRVLAEAIYLRSFVFGKIKAAADQGKAESYQPSLEVLKGLLDRALGERQPA